MSSQTVTLDVREEIRRSGEPFSKIMSAVAQLRPDENLLLLAPFEPEPLFGVLAKQGFNHTAREIENGDWEVLFTRSRGGEALAEKSETGNRNWIRAFLHRLLQKLWKWMLAASNRRSRW